MCGIVGYLGVSDSKKPLIEGLKRLEYRGYDSSGLTFLDQSQFIIKKSLGRVSQLEQLVQHLAPSTCGIAHTRWATHGKVSIGNAHPHQSYDGRFAVVHNGVIDNYKNLESDYLAGVIKTSETDTETLINLLSLNMGKLDYLNAIAETLKSLDGSYALVILDRENPNQLIVAKNKSPLIIGQAIDETMIASDVLALAGYVNQIHVMDDETFGIINKSSLKLLDYELNTVKNSFETFDIDPVLSTRGDYPHYMLKEIFEQPDVIQRLITHAEHSGFDKKLLTTLERAGTIEIIAAGTSYHAGLFGKALIEKSLGIRSHVHVASEFAYYPPEIDDDAVFIIISQSGETADLIACLPHIRNHQWPLITLTNVNTSRLAKEADFFLDLLAGPEIAVASTKAFTAQVTLIALLVDKIKRQNEFASALEKVIQESHKLLKDHDKIKTYIEHFLTKHNAFFIGRGVDFTLALEASLKLKEISYIQSEAFPAGELKHGTIALIENDTPVISLLTEKKTASLTRANIEELKARGASSFVISTEELSENDDQITLSSTGSILDALMLTIPTQLIAYYAALHRGHDIDKPRNLAKSVTVE